jgi:hypothetical protein
MSENKVKKLFIDRQREQEIILETLHKLMGSHSGSARDSKPVINFWGIGGIGKTAFFEQIPKWLPPNWKFTYFDLANAGDATDNQQVALVGIKAALQQQAQIELEMDNRQIAVLDLATHVQIWLKTHSSRLLLVLDNLEHGRGWVDKLQQLLLTLPMEGRILVVTGSRSNGLLTNFSLRTKLQNHQINVFESSELLESELAEELETNLFTEGNAAIGVLVKQLLSLSVGYPKALNYLLNQLAPGATAESALEFLTEHVSELKIATMNMVLDNYTTLPGTPEPRQQQFNVALREMCVFRRFDDNILKDTAKKAVRQADQKLFSGRSFNPLYFMRLAQDMKMLNLAYWDRKRYGYYIDETYRRILIQGLEAENLTDYISRQHNAALQYLGLLQTANPEVETHAIYLIELIYHLAILTELQPELYRPHLIDLAKYIRAGQLPGDYFSSLNSPKPTEDKIKLPPLQLLKDTFYAKETQELNLPLKSTLKNIDESLFDWL